jgi:hypothetical protein
MEGSGKKDDVGKRRGRTKVERGRENRIMIREGRGI